MELIRPPNGPFGFVISRGKGRPDTGNFSKAPPTSFDPHAVEVEMIRVASGGETKRGFVCVSGVYVEKVADSSGEGPYTGLLGVGDEILQVNGETVADLSLDQVTRLMTRESVASLRVMPARRLQR